MASLLCVRGLTVTVGHERDRVAVVRGIDLDVAAGSMHALVGESGCGKSMAVSALLDLAPGDATVTFDRYEFDGSPRTVADLRALRGRGLSMVFQDPSLALDPLQRVGEALDETLRTHRRGGEVTSAGLLADAGLPDPARTLRAYPHQLSGGQRQRVCLALALASAPRLLVLDEATTALDPPLRVALVETLEKKRADLGLGMLFVTHDLALASRAADVLSVMYGGRIVESGPARQVLASPRHPYTRALVASVPRFGVSEDQLPTIAGVVPAARDWPVGCPFAPRCDRASVSCREAPPIPFADGSRTLACQHPLEVSA